MVSSKPIMPINRSVLQRCCVSVLVPSLTDAADFDVVLVAEIHNVFVLHLEVDLFCLFMVTEDVVADVLV